jgi:outer membrane murein-binding lipoprotein Lpp
MNMKPDKISREDTDAAFDWETLDSQVNAVLEETQAALEEALAATRKLGQWMERLHTLSAFMRQMESGLSEVRQQLEASPRAHRSAPTPLTAPKAGTVEVSEPWPLEPEEAEPEVGEEPPLTALEAEEAEGRAEPSEAAAVVEAEEPPPAAPEAEEAEGRAEPSEAAAVVEAEEPPPAAPEAEEAEGRAEPSEAAAVAEAEEAPAPAEGEPLEAAPSVAEVSISSNIRLQIESSEANIDLMVVERALRETPGVADVDLLDYAGKRARVLVTFKGGERPKEVADPEHLAANVQERLAKLTWDGSLSVSATE